MSINDIIMSIDNFVWGISLIILSLGSGLLFSIVLKFPQIRLFKEMLKCSFKNNKADSGLTPFQALSIAIGGRVGTGNITGTASAILFGVLELYFGCASWQLFVLLLLMLNQH